MITSVKTVINTLTGWIRDEVNRAEADGVVLGISGGIDSAVACGLALEALGPDKVSPVWLPCHSSVEDYTAANLVAETYGITLIKTVDLGPSFDVLVNALAISPELSQDSVAAGNVKARLRTIALYGFANKENLLVLGTTNKTEATFGYFTKGGDGMVDLEPLGDLYKNEVRLVGAHLPIPVPHEIIVRTPSAGLHPDQTDEGELGCSYDDLDTFAKAYNRDATLGLLDDDLNLRLLGHVQRNQHKSNLPPVCYVREEYDPED